jgi:hypothetical protein
MNEYEYVTATTLHLVAERLEARLLWLEKYALKSDGAIALDPDYLETARTYAAVLAVLRPV